MIIAKLAFCINSISMKKLILSGILSIFVISGFSQSANFQAQGYYYKAKELYEAKNYSAALPYLAKSRTTLGGSNEQLQYLYIMSYVGVGDWVNAKKELVIYFDIYENRVKPVYFSKYVERLTDDETKALSKAMVDIEEKAAYEESPAAKKEKKLKEIVSIIDALLYKDLYKDWEFSEKLGKNIKYFTENLSSTGNYCYKFTTYSKEIDPRPSCTDYSSEKAVLSFCLENISSVLYVAAGNVSYCGDGGQVPMYSSPALILKFKSLVKKSSNDTFFFKCWGTMDGLHSKDNNANVAEVKIRLKNTDQNKIKRLNELLPQIK